jgi:LPXTG-motif cell wall-anchored protein
MKKHTATAGPTSLGWVRSLLAFRHHNPVARLVSTLAAFAVAMLLVVGTGPAYADDAPDPSADTTSTTTEDPAPATEEPAPATEESAPATEEPASAAEESAPADNGGGSSEDASPSVSHALKTLAKSGGVTTLALEPPTDPDWIWQGSAPTQEDGEKDDTAYGGGSSEDTDPSTWSQASADTPKADLLKYYFNKDLTTDIVVSFGFTRASISGDTAFAAEFNQAANGSDTPPQPVRTPGDYLLKFHVDSGNATLEFVHAYIWKAVGDFAQHEIDNPGFTCEERYDSGFGWCEIDRVNGSFDTRVTDDGFTAEAMVNLSDLFPTEGCSPIFHSVNLRGESSAENWTNSLQDYLPLPGAEVESTCASLVINKFRDGTSTKLTGAHFDVYEGTGTGGTKIFSDISDGGPDDADSEVGQITLMNLDPGTYTVVEISPPGSDTVDPNDDYFLADPDTITLPVAEKGIATFNFYDVKIWQALNVTKDGSGAYDAQYLWSITKGVGSTTAGPFSPSATKNVAAAGNPTSANFGYEVTVTQGAQVTSNIAVTGNVYVDNPNDEPVDITLSDTLAGADCSFADSTVTVPASAVDEAYAYTCTYPDGTDPGDFDTSNDASIAWDASTYPQDDGNGAPLDGNSDGDYTDDASATIAYTATETDKDVTIVDDHHPLWAPDYTDPWTISWTAEGVTETRTYTRKLSAAPGACTTEVNRADVMSGETSLDDASATAKLCVAAVIVSPPKPPVVKPPAALPNTGGPNVWYLGAGLALLLAGSSLVLGDRRRKHRS